MADPVAEKYDEQTRQYRDATQLTKENHCGACDALLVVIHAGDEWVAKCADDKSHEGFRRVETPTDIMRRGGDVPTYIKDGIERRVPPVEKLETMAGIWQAKQPKISPVGAIQAAMFSLQIGLDPRFGEIACLEFGQGGAKVPTVMITETGWQRLALRECPDLIDRPPVIINIMKAVDKQEYGAMADSFVAVAKGTLKGDDPRLPIRESVGVYTRAELDRDRNRGGGQGLPPPSVNNPQNHARVRASRHFYEDHLPMAVERGREAWHQTVKAIEGQHMVKVIEAEFRYKDEPANDPPQASSAPARPPQRQEHPQQRQANPNSPASDKALKYLLVLGEKAYGWTPEDMERELGKPLKELNAAEASKMIDDLKEAGAGGQPDMFANGG